MINNSFGDKSMFEYLIGLDRKITFDVMLWPLVVCALWSGSERVDKIPVVRLNRAK